MKIIFKMGIAIVCVALTFSCKQGRFSTDAAPTSAEIASTTGSEATAATMATVTAVPQRKRIRTAEIKFKVKNVAQSTYAIERTASRYGGLITSNNLQSDIQETSRTKVSNDSILESTKYVVANNITLRIPNRALDTVIKTIAKEIDYLDYRVIRADDVALKMLANQMTQRRSTDHNRRLAANIDAKGTKLSQISDAENELLDKNETRDQAALENLSLQEQVNYSTITLALYQKETVRYEMVAVDHSGGGYGNFGLELWDGIKTGWYILERILAFVVQLWSVILIGGLAVLALRRFADRRKPVSMDN